MRRPVAIVALLSVVFIYFVYSYLFLRRYDEYLDSQITFTGKIQDIKENEYGITLYLKGSIEGEEGIVGIVFYPSDYDYVIGQQLVISGILTNFPKASNYGQSDISKYMRSTGYDYMMDKVVVVSKDDGKSFVKVGLHNIRLYITQIIDKYYHDPYKAVIKGMLTGDKKGVDEELKDMYAYGGIAHILSISGLHISIIGGIVYYILRKIRAPKLAEAVLTISLLIGYGLMVGLSASIIRALSMYIYRRVGKILKQGTDMPTSLSLAALATAIIKPYVVFSSGFMFSFLSVSAIVFIVPIWRRIITRSRQIVDMFLCGLSINITILPIIINIYHGFSPYGILVNLLVVPSVGVCLGSAVVVVSVHTLMSFIPLGIFNFIIRFAVWFGEGILKIYGILLSFFMTLPGGMVHIGQRGAGRLLIYYTLLILLVILSNRYLRKMYIRFCLLRNYRLLYERNNEKYIYLTKQNHKLLLRFRIWQWAVIGVMMIILLINPNHEKKISMLDVGQGDGIYIEANNRHFFVDGGSTSEKKIGERIIEPYLLYEGCDHIDGWFLTHGDEDHVNGFIEVCERGNIKIDKVFIPVSNIESMGDVINAGISVGAEVVPLQFGDEIKGNDYNFKVISPKENVKYEDVNRASLVMLLTIDDMDVLLTGDASDEAEELCMKYLDDIDILKVGHHGSKFSSSYEFLDDMNPEVALISAGLNNSYGHPHDETLKRLYYVGAEIYRTDMQGCITLRITGRDLKIIPFLK